MILLKTKAKMFIQDAAPACVAKFVIVVEFVKFPFYITGLETAQISIQLKTYEETAAWHEPLICA